MSHPTAVILVVGLNRTLLADAPRLSALAAEGHCCRLTPVLPAVTCTVQSTMLTGQPPSAHGIVGNGWFDRDLNEVLFWKQSNRLVQADKVWESARRRDPTITCANCFWWYNMYSSVDYAVTPRPMYKADGRKIPDVYTRPVALRDDLQAELGRFPLFNFWGPAASIESSAWIAAAARFVDQRYQPDLTFVYLPHLDYSLQKLGPGHPSIPAEVAAVDAVAGELIDHLRRRDVRIMVVSEYGVEPVDQPIHVNRHLRAAGWVEVRTETGHELLDVGASTAFAVADHQVAHVYVQPGGPVDAVARACSELDGVDEVLDRAAQVARGINHPRAGDLVLVAKPRHWFTYYYWLKEASAPDFAHTVDIHRKPGYDPVELFLDPRLVMPRARIAGKLLRRKLGMRTLLDVIPTDATLVKGSHGRTALPADEQPIALLPACAGPVPDEIPCGRVHDLLLDQLFGAA